MLRKIVYSLLSSVFITVLSATVPAAGDEVLYSFHIDVSLFSVQEGPQGLVKESHHFYGSGFAETGSTLGLNCGDEGFQFEVDLRPIEEGGTFFVDLEVKPDAKSEQVKLRKERLSMADLKPVSLDLAKNEQDNRSYRLNLVPSIRRIDNTRRPLDGSELKLDRWSFNGSKVIVDNWRYAGEINAYGMSLAFVDVPGYARVEFALSPFPEAQPLGYLQDGTIRITKEGGLNPQTVVIDNVKVGSPGLLVTGSRYQVWVRWSPSKKSVMAGVQEIASLDYDKILAESKLDDTTKAQLRAQQQAIKEKAGQLNEADFAPDGILSLVLGSIGMQSGGGIIKGAEYPGTAK